ncbi:hypothetical protein WJX74_008659 [Apatococcus lobatus]|uniref:ABM domain-containing protein n=1 Tax=Apatococcus lobatus TaxID=904363 RepID=A0AAW1QIV3_9CHLO
MKSSVVAVTLACVACLAGTAQAALRSSDLDAFQMIPDVLATSQSNKDPEDKKAYVLIDYAVQPAKQDEFIAAFEKTAAPTKKEEGSIVYTLSRNIDDNLTFYLYSEWTGMKAYGEHFESAYLKEYLKTIAELNVVWKLHILEPVVY